MIKSTFIFIPGIGVKTEEYLWKKGIITWEDLKRCTNTISLNKAKRKIIEDYLNRANDALSKHNISFFMKYLPQKEYWRMYNEFRTKTLFLDIETTGLSLYYDKITVIGTYDGHTNKLFIRGNNLDEIVNYLQNYKIIITFNGKLFDIPFIKKEFPEIRIPMHIDLKYLLRSLGITGSLKEIEEKLGIKRPKEVQEIDGRHAAVLWNKFVKGDDNALEKLLLYNIYDTMNLQTIMHFCYQKKIEELKSKMSHDPYQRKLIQHKNENSLILSTFDFSKPNFSIPKVTVQRVNNGLLNVFLNNKKLTTIDRSKIERIDIKIESLIQKIKKQNFRPISVGIDLSGTEKRNTGICILKGREAYLDVVRTDDEIISKTISANPAVISIDSPLSLPRGRCCVDDTCECRRYGIIRECERILKKRGINVYPCLIKSMQKLTMRGIRLARIFEKHGFEVIESYPGAAQDIMGLPRKRINLGELEIDLMNMGIKPFSNRKIITHDEIDALTSALVGFFYLAGSYEAVGNLDEGYLIIPALQNDNNQNRGKMRCP